jgi:hypothetical protein
MPWSMWSPSTYGIIAYFTWFWSSHVRMNGFQFLYAIQIFTIDDKNSMNNTYIYLINLNPWCIEYTPLTLTEKLLYIHVKEYIFFRNNSMENIYRDYIYHVTLAWNHMWKRFETTCLFQRHFPIDDINKYILYNFDCDLYKITITASN